MPKKVLVVDDDQSVRELYVPYFAMKGYDTVAAIDGEEGMAILAREKIDLIVLDLAMPGMQGEDVMEQIAQNPEWKNIPIIVESALGPETGRPQKVKERFSGRLRFEIFQRPNSLEKLQQAMGEMIAL
jgi:CheY-like chemotaxis protein